MSPSYCAEKNAQTTAQRWLGIGWFLSPRAVCKATAGSVTREFCVDMTHRLVGRLARRGNPSSPTVLASYKDIRFLTTHHGNCIKFRRFNLCPVLSQLNPLGVSEPAYLLGSIALAPHPNPYPTALSCGSLHSTLSSWNVLHYATDRHGIQRTQAPITCAPPLPPCQIIHISV